MRWLAFAACSWGPVLWLEPAGAEPASGAVQAVVEPAPARHDLQRSERALIEWGIGLRKADDDRGARSAFTQAWNIGGSPEALAQLALSEQALGLWLEAHEHLLTALEHAQHPWIIEHRPVLAAALTEIESRFGRLEVSCNVAGADVSMDGRRVGRTPLPAPFYLLAGRSVIQVSTEGYFDVTRQVEIDAGALSRLDVTLTPSGVPAPSSDAPPASDTLVPARATHASVSRGDSATRLGEPHGTSSARDVLKYGSLGLAAVGVAVGVTGYVMREVNVAVFNDDIQCSNVPQQPRSKECSEAAAALRLGQGLAISGFAAAGVFGAVGLYLWLDEPSGHSLASMRCGVGLGTVACGARF